MTRRSRRCARPAGTEVICARLEPGDVPEDIAADRLATPLVSPLIARSRAATGRVNLSAEVPGLLRIDVGRIDRLNTHRRGAHDRHAAGLCRRRAERPDRDDQDHPVLGPRQRPVGGGGVGPSGRQSADAAPVPAPKGRSGGDRTPRPEGQRHRQDHCDHRGADYRPDRLPAAAASVARMTRKRSAGRWTAWSARGPICCW